MQECYCGKHAPRKSAPNPHFNVLCYFTKKEEEHQSHQSRKQLIRRPFASIEDTHG